jgi:hypothetical protein
MGWCKVIVDASSGKVLGVHVIGAHVADFIHEAALAMQVGVTVTQVAEMIHAHPTWQRDSWKRQRIRKVEPFIRFVRRQADALLTSR